MFATMMILAAAALQQEPPVQQEPPIIVEGERLGVSVDKLNLVVVWREAPQFTQRERAALAWTEALTLLSEGVSDEVYAEASAEFSEKELAYLTSAVAAINVWNRFGAAFRWTPPARKRAAGAAG